MARGPTGPLLGAGALALSAVLVAALAPAPAAAHLLPDALADEWTESDACWRQAARAYARHQAPAQPPSRSPTPAASASPAPTGSASGDGLPLAGAAPDAPTRTWLHRGAALGGWDAAPPHGLDDATLPEALLDLYAAKGLETTPGVAAGAAGFAADLDPRLRAHLAPLVSRLAHAVEHHHDAYLGAGATHQAPLVHAADGLLLEASLQAPLLQALPHEAWPGEPVRDPAGVVAVGTPGPDVYTEDRFLQVDPGGEDRYHNNAGGGAVYPTTQIFDMRIQEVALHLDLGGDDYYGPAEGDLTEPTAAQGGARDGVGVMVDWGGNDTYVASEQAQGGVFRSGVGVAWDRQGNDSWEAHRLGQGASEGGLGLLLEERGDDDYYLDGRGLGYGVGDAVGLLVDTSGNDFYNASSSTVVGDGDFGGHGVFLDDGEGDDAYPFYQNTWASDGATWARADVGVGCDDG